MTAVRASITDRCAPPASGPRLRLATPAGRFFCLAGDVVGGVDDSLSAISKLKLVELNEFDRFVTLIPELGVDFAFLHNSFAVFSIILAHLEVVEGFMPSVTSFIFRRMAPKPSELSMKPKVSIRRRYNP